MGEPSEKEALDTGLKIVWIIWGAMLGTLPLLIALSEYLGPQRRGDTGGAMPVALLENAVFAVSVAMLVGAYFMRRGVLSGRLTGESKYALFKPRLDMPQPVFVQTYLIAIVIPAALAESVGFFGFVLFVLGASYKTLYGFMTLSAIAMFYFRPQRAELEALARARKG